MTTDVVFFFSKILFLESKAIHWQKMAVSVFANIRRKGSRKLLLKFDLAEKDSRKIQLNAGESLLDIELTNETAASGPS
jgi:hypothetical protein